MSTHFESNKKKVALITGITGQDGSYLTELLLEKGYKIYGIVRRNSVLYNWERLQHIRDKIILNYGDMTDGAGLNNIINSIIQQNKDFERLEIYNLVNSSSSKRPSVLRSIANFLLFALISGAAS